MNAIISVLIALFVFVTGLIAARENRMGIFAADFRLRPALRVLFFYLVPFLVPFLAGRTGAGEFDADQRRWMIMGLSERMLEAERIGEEGARRYARMNNFNPVYNGTEPGGVSQGVDQVYKGLDGRVKAIEAKGGNSALGQGYGYRQGSPEWAIEASRRVLNSPAASRAQKEAARIVLEAARTGKLDVITVRTPHVLGKAGLPTVVSSASSGKTTAAMAGKIISPASSVRGAIGKGGAGVPVGASKASKGALGAPGVGKVIQVSKVLSYAGTVAIAADAGIKAYNTEKAYAEGRLTSDERMKAHVKTSAQTAAGSAGAWGGAQAGAMAGAAVGVWFGGIGAPIGAAVGGTIGGIGGYFGGESVADAVVDWLW